MHNSALGPRPTQSSDMPLDHLKVGLVTHTGNLSEPSNQSITKNMCLAPAHQDYSRSPLSLPELQCVVATFNVLKLTRDIEANGHGHM